MKKNLYAGLAVLAALLLVGCVSVGERVTIPIVAPDGERLTIYAHQQSVPDWMLARDSLKLNFMVKGEVSEKQLQLISTVEKSCKLFTDTVRPNEAVAIFANGALYAVAGFIGVGLGSQYFQGAKFIEYAMYGGSATGFAGLANGVITLGGQTYTFENCSREALSRLPQYGIGALNKSPY